MLIYFYLISLLFFIIWIILFHYHLFIRFIIFLLMNIKTMHQLFLFYNQICYIITIFLIKNSIHFNFYLINLLIFRKILILRILSYFIYFLINYYYFKMFIIMIITLITQLYLIYHYLFLHYYFIYNLYIVYLFHQ